MNISKVEFMDNGDILVVSVNGQIHIKTKDILQMDGCVSVNDTKEKVYFIYDAEDENVVATNVKENEIQNAMRKYAEEDCDGFEEDFSLEVYELKDRYKISSVSRVDIKKI